MRQRDPAEGRWWQRVGSPRQGFRYLDAAGRRVRDGGALARIRRLAIPPAWTDVRIAPAPHARLQALGLDGSGRTQYLYHPAFASERSRQKFERLERFGQRLPDVRKAVADRLRGSGLGRERVLAGILRLLEIAHFRLGAERGARDHRSYGVTTLRPHHVRVGRGGRVQFVFRAKHHVLVRRDVADPQMTRLLRELRAAGQARLFGFHDEEGRWHRVSAADVNAFLKDLAGPDVVAKDFRTWAGTMAAARAFDAAGPAQGRSALRRHEASAYRAAAADLGNTPAVARASYVHPWVVEAHREGVLLGSLRGPDLPSADGLTCDERALLLLLRRRRLGTVDALLEWVTDRLAHVDLRTRPPVEPALEQPLLVNPT